MKREKFGSRLGFILVSAGCAIGIGQCMEVSILVWTDGRSSIYPDLSGIPVDHGSAGYDLRVRHRPRQSFQCRRSI